MPGDVLLCVDSSGVWLDVEIGTCSIKVRGNRPLKASSSAGSREHSGKRS